MNHKLWRNNNWWKRNLWKILPLCISGSCSALAAQAARAPIEQFYYMNDAAAMRSLQQNSQRISLLSPAWFSLDKNGDVQASVDQQIWDWAQSHSVPVMPLITNGAFDQQIAHSLLTDETFQSTAMGNLLRVLSEHPYVGLQLDFENIAPADRDAYSRFVEKLGVALHNLHLKISVAVPAPLTPAPLVPGSTAGSWIANDNAASFDYRRLAAAADFLSLMTYDEFTSPDRPGPLAEISWIEASVRKVLEQAPANKILLGLALYYRHWSKGLVEEGPYAQAEAMAARAHAAITIDPVSGGAAFRFTDEQGQHVVWLENERTLSRKLQLATKFQLGGFAAWRLGQEDPLVWKGSFRK